jgi:competence protein ComEC
VPDPLLLPFVFLALGVVLGTVVPFTPGEATWPILAFALLAIPRKRTRWPAALLAMLFAGILAQAWHEPAPRPELDATSREIVTVEGCVVVPTVFSEDRAQFTLELQPAARARVTLPVEEGVDPPQRLAYGTRVEIEARFRPPHNYNNPGGFDYARYLARQDIYWNASMPRHSMAKILEGRCGTPVMAAVFALRSSILDRIERLYPEDNYSQGMMEAILAGETSRLEKVWTENFRRTGTFHALVISGVHVSVLAGVLLFLLRFVPISEIAALAITAAAAWLYALVSGMSAPVVRAAGGFTLFLIARFFFRPTRLLNLLAAVGMAYLLIDPGQLFDASFQLSFLSVAALGALAAPLLEATSAPRSRGLRNLAHAEADPHLEPRVAQFRVETRLAAETLSLWTSLPVRWTQPLLAWPLRGALFAYELFVVSLAIQVGLALPMVEYFHRLSLSGLSANLIVVPAMNLLVPVGFMAILTGWELPARAAGWLLTISSRVADWHARLEPAWRLPDPPLWLALAFAVSLVAFAILLGSRYARWPALAALLASVAALLVYQRPVDARNGSLELTAIDVGQGDSLLLVFPQGATMLIDGGGFLTYGRSRKTSFDTGEDVVSPYLWTRGLRRLDIVVATHAHQDHIGGLAAVLANFRPKQFWTGANPPLKLEELARALGIKVIEQTAGLPFDYSGARVEILAPRPDGYSSRTPGNNDSLAMRVSYRGRSFLLMGDLERPMEARLLADAAASHADVLKVGHHGSRTSTIPPFFDAVNPSIALISAGYENSFGHPHPDVLARLEQRHSTILRTDLDGLSTVWTDGNRLWYRIQRWEPTSGPLRIPALADLVH